MAFWVCIRVCIIIGLFACALALVGLVARHVNVTNHASLVLALSSPVLLLAVPAAGAFYLLRRRWVLAAAACLLTVVLVSVVIPGRPRPLESTVGFRVMSMNLLEGNADALAVTTLARGHADVVSVQELTDDALKRLSANGMDAAFPHRLVRFAAGESGAALWSRYPLQALPENSEALPITARVDVPGVTRAPVVVVVHLSAPWPWTIEWWRTDIAQLESRLGRLAADSAPVVVAGDFNSTADIKQFRRILDLGYADAPLPPPTYPADKALPALLPIDHILGHDATPTTPWTATVPGTDHRAVLATVAVPR